MRYIKQAPRKSCVNNQQGRQHGSGVEFSITRDLSGSRIWNPDQDRIYRALLFAAARITHLNEQ